jgi:hypothetical protein
MNDPPSDDTVRARMRGIRREIDQDLEDVSASARNAVDWRHYVKAYPWACLGTAAALGFLVVPRRCAAATGDLAAPFEPSKTGHPIIASASVALRGSVDALVAAAVNIAVREATAYLGRSAGRVMEATRHSWTSNHDSHRTS